MGGRRKKHKPKYKPKETQTPALPQQAIHYTEPPLTVFISSLIDKMHEERNMVQRAIDHIPIARSWRFEDTPASSQAVEESYLSKVRTCDIFLLVLGSEYSQAVACEYETAIESQKPILVFVRQGDREDNQRDFIRTIGTKYASYSEPDDLHLLVVGSIWDELIRAHRGVIQPRAAAEVITQVPLPVAPKIEDVLGYFIVGLDGVVIQNYYRRLGASAVPADLEELCPNLEPLSIVNFSEVNAAVTAIQDANLKSIKAPNRTEAFGRELQKKATEFARSYLRGEKVAEREIHPPGAIYYYWGMEPNFARLVKILRLEEWLKEPVQIKRSRYEVMFRDAEHFLELYAVLGDIMQRAPRGDIDEIDRLIDIEAERLGVKR